MGPEKIMSEQESTASDPGSEKREYYRESGELLHQQKTKLWLDGQELQCMVLNINRKGVAVGVNAVRVADVQTKDKRAIKILLQGPDESIQVDGKIVVKKISGAKAMLGIMFDEFIDPNRFGNFLDIHNETAAEAIAENISGLTPDSPEMDCWDQAYYPEV